MSNYDELIGLMKECDKWSDQLIERQANGERVQVERRASDEESDGESDAVLRSVSTLLSLMSAYESKLTQIIENEELFRMYFYRFLAFEKSTNLSEVRNDEQLMRIKREDMPLLNRLFKTIQLLVSSNLTEKSLNSMLENSEQLSSVSKRAVNEWMKAMAEMNVKLYESSQEKQLIY